MYDFNISYCRRNTYQHTGQCNWKHTSSGTIRCQWRIWAGSLLFPHPHYRPFCANCTRINIENDIIKDVFFAHTLKLPLPPRRTFRSVPTRRNSVLLESVIGSDRGGVSRRGTVYEKFLSVLIVRIKKKKIIKSYN